MRYRILPLLAALLLLAAACGGGDDDDAATTTTSSSTPTSSTSSASSTAPPRAATAGDLARVMVQIDDHLRESMVVGGACLRRERDGCVGGALEAFDKIGRSAQQMVDVLPKLLEKGSDLYQGTPTGELQARLDATVNLGATLKARFDAARAACVPEFPPECEGPSEELRTALDEVLLDMNHWRDDYDPATDPALQG
jgi:hypothetical protein